MPDDLQFCHYCGLVATHFCAGCGNFVCDSARCAARAAADAFARSPTAAIAQAPAFVARQVQAAGDKFGDAFSRVADIVTDALGFKP